MKIVARTGALALLMTLLAPWASAYYYWVYFAGRSAPFTPIPARFDLASLPNQSIPYLISSQGPAVMVPGDTFQALISQIRLAASVWNIPTSAAKLSFGGLSPMTQPDSSPEVDVVFDDDMAPGLLAYTRLNTIQDVSGALAGGATFIPILSARVQLHNDLTRTSVPQASWSDAFFLTIAHEFGHSLGLQHTLTSSLMSTETTRATTKSTPLAADDIAGISLLYPANGYPANTGSITGSVTLGGAAVNMASVVAYSATTGVAISAITNPDGTYAINGIPAGSSYFVYAHPLPPASAAESYPNNIVPPQDASGQQFLPNTGFGTQFYGGGTDWTQAPQISVVAGKSTDGINFNVSPRSGPAISSVVTYGLPTGTVYVGTPPLQSGSYTYLFVAGNGLTVSNKGAIAITPGLNISVIGGSAQIRTGSVSYWGSGYDWMIIDAGTVSKTTPTALAMTLNGDLYVLPNAFSVVPSASPVISGISGTTDGNGNATVTVAGSNLNANTKILFDGARANFLQQNDDGSVVVAAPPAANGYKATVEALSPDSQTSAQLLGTSAPPAFVYGGPSQPYIAVNPPTAVAGTDTMIEITGYNTNFLDGRTVVGFGSSDISVKQLWVVSPGLLRLNVSVNSGAAAVATTISVATGLQLNTLDTTFQVTPANGQITLRTPIVNKATGLAGVPVGGQATISTSGLPFTATSATLAGWTLTISGQPVSFTMADSGQITADVPVGLLSGPAVVQLLPASGTHVPPVLMQIDPAPPVIQGASTVQVPGAASVNSSTFHAGDNINVTVQGLADALGNLPPASSLIVNVAGVAVTASAVTATGGVGNPCMVEFTLPSSLTPGAQTISIRSGTRVSSSFTITIQ